MPTENDPRVPHEHEGSCFCGAVRVRVTGQPVAMGYCHCDSCRSWSAGPVNAFTLWAPNAVTVIQGGNNLASYNKTARSVRKWCKTCGGHVLTEHPHWNLVDVYAAVIPAFPFKPMLHVNYAETVLPVQDQLPKQADVPAEMGGSGKLLAA